MEFKAVSGKILNSAFLSNLDERRRQRDLFSFESEIQSEMLDEGRERDWRRVRSEQAETCALLAELLACFGGR